MTLVLLSACALVLDVPEVNYEVRNFAADGGPISSSDAAADSTDGSLPDHVPDDASSPVDPCDRDRDGVRSESGGCGGTDCNDDDPRIHPGAGFVGDVPPDASAGDWDCDGVVTREYPVNASTSCTSTQCMSHSQGFKGEPACGESATFRRCAPTGGTACGAITSTETVRCR